MSFEENAEELAEDVASLGFDLAALVDAEAPGHRLRPHRPRRDRGDRRVRPGRPVRPPRSRRVVGERQTRGARHHRVAVCRPAEREHPARGAAPAVPLAARPRPHRRHYRRKRRADADAARPRGVRLGRRDSAGPSRGRSDLHAPDPRGEVSRLAPRHQRVPVPDRRPTACRCCPSPRCSCSTTPRWSASRAACRSWIRCSSGQRVLPRQHGAGLRHGRHRQDQPGRALCRRRLPSRGAVPVFPLRGVAPADGAQHARRPAWTCSRGWTAASSSSTRTGPRASAWRPTWSRSIAPSNASAPTWWSSTR